MASPAGYSRAQIALHWVIAALIVVQNISSDWMEDVYRAVRRGHPVDETPALPHVLVGVLILALVIWRLVLRARRGAPDLPPGGHPMLDLVAVWTHRLLYLLMLLVPLAGMAAWGGGVHEAGDVHGALFNLFAVLILLHIAGAVYHQWIKKDGLLDRMMKAG